MSRFNNIFYGGVGGLTQKKFLQKRIKKKVPTSADGSTYSETLVFHTFMLLEKW